MSGDDMVWGVGNWICDRCGQYGHHAFNCWQYGRPLSISEINSTSTYSIMPKGWQCPECKTCYNPDVKSCDCNKKETLGRFSWSDIDHEGFWVMDGETFQVFKCLTAQDALALCEFLNGFELALRNAEDLQGEV